MNERKLELKDIAGYLPYELKVRHGRMCDDGKYHETVRKFGSNDFVYLRDGNDIIGKFDKIIPILRPLSDLYKPIMHNGKEIVPIVEFCKAHISETAEWEINGEQCECTESNRVMNVAFINKECLDARFKMKGIIHLSPQN